MESHLWTDLDGIKCCQGPRDLVIPVFFKIHRHSCSPWTVITGLKRNQLVTRVIISFTTVEGHKLHMSKVLIHCYCYYGHLSCTAGCCAPTLGQWVHHMRDTPRESLKDLLCCFPWIHGKQSFFPFSPWFPHGKIPLVCLFHSYSSYKRYISSYNRWYWRIKPHEPPWNSYEIPISTAAVRFCRAPCRVSRTGCRPLPSGATGSPESDFWWFDQQETVIWDASKKGEWSWDS